jgi:hypothetical protein
MTSPIDADGLAFLRTVLPAQGAGRDGVKENPPAWGRQRD